MEVDSVHTDVNEDKSAAVKHPQDIEDPDGPTDVEDKTDVEDVQDDANHSEPAQAEEAEEEAVPEEEKPSGAAALLAKLRGSTSGRKQQSAASATLERLRAKRSKPPTAPPATEETAPPVAKSTPVPASTPLVPKSSPGYVTLTVKTAGGEHQLSLPDGSLAKAAEYAANALGLVPVDLAGSMEGWYRLDQSDNGLLGNAKVSELDPDIAIDLQFVQNTTVRATLSVADPSLEISTVVGTAIPAGWLIGHLRRWLKLPQGDWHLVIDGERLNAWQLIDDYDPQDGVRIEVRT